MKERQELFSIGEIARAVGVTRRMILNYEERGLICPDVKKGDTGNRYYTIDTFTKIRNIRSLQDLGCLWTRYGSILMIPSIFCR